MWNTIKDWFNPPEVIEPKSYEIVADIVLNKRSAHPSWRTGMWVMVGDKIAILHVLEAASAEVHFVNPEDGQTILIQNVSLNSLRQAKLHEIPQCRRDNFPADLAARYGYGD